MELEPKRAVTTTTTTTTTATTTITCLEESTDSPVSILRPLLRQTLNADFPPVFAVVSDLLMNEARSEEKLKQKSLTASEDSGHDSAQSSLNAGSFSESSG